MKFSQVRKVYVAKFVAIASKLDLSGFRTSQRRQ
jgi:hypothetical protein